MRNKCSHITEEHLLFLEITGEKTARVLIHKLGTIKISLYPIKEYLINMELTKALESNKPLKQIAKEVGVHLSTVYRFQKRMKDKKFSQTPVYLRKNHI